MDGYAVRSVDIAGASHDTPVVLNIVDEVCAGMMAEIPVEKGCAVRIMTGGPMPSGADCVVKQEDTDYGEERVEIYKALKHHENYCFAGENFRKGQLIIPAGTEMGFTHAGVLASLGKERVKVYRRPRVAVIATGDEVVELGQPLPPAKIYNSNMYLLISAAKTAGAEITMSVMSGDDMEDIGQHLKHAAEVADVILTSGGIGAGKKDLMRTALRNAGGEFYFSRIDTKIGGAVTFGTLSEKAVICLSGSPYSAASAFQLAGRLAIDMWAGRETSLDKFELICEMLPKTQRKDKILRNVVNDGDVVSFKI